MNAKSHWEQIYATKTDSELSWTQGEPTMSLQLIGQVAPRGRVVDVGGGTSPLAGGLVDAGYSVAVVDISEAAIERSRQKLGRAAKQVQWIVGDVTALHDIGAFDVWHDRAVFHFLTAADDRDAYLRTARACLVPGGHLVLGTFALDGPEKCSGLPVAKYDGAKLAKAFAEGFVLQQLARETHVTPWGKDQAFQYAVLERVT